MQQTVCLVGLHTPSTQVWSWLLLCMCMSHWSYILHSAQTILHHLWGWMWCVHVMWWLLCMHLQNLRFEKALSVLTRFLINSVKLSVNMNELMNVAYVATSTPNSRHVVFSQCFESLLQLWSGWLKHWITSREAGRVLAATLHAQIDGKGSPAAKRFM